MSFRGVYVWCVYACILCIDDGDLFKLQFPVLRMRGVRVHGAAHEEFVCEVVDELDLDYLKVSVKVWYKSAPGKVPYNAEAFWMIYLQVTIIS